MKLRKQTVGPLETNCYILRDSESGQTLVVDPGAPDRHLLEAVAAEGGNLTLVLLTHGHFDHIGGIQMLRREYPDCKIAINVADAGMLTDSKSNASYYFGSPLTAYPADVTLTEGSELRFGNHLIRVLHTPGHSPGSSIYLLEDWMFSGDTLFAGDIGRTDLPGGDSGLMSLSLTRIGLLNPQLKVLPGHGPSSTLAYELKTNPDLKGSFA